MSGRVLATAVSLIGLGLLGLALYAFNLMYRRPGALPYCDSWWKRHWLDLIGFITLIGGSLAFIIFV